VIVPAYNAAATIGAALSALAAQQLDGGYEVIVVDGGSSDGTRQLLDAAGDRITVLHNPDREPASSRNLGAARAAGAALAFTDADCEPDPGWLGAGLAALQRAEIVQGKVLPREGHGPFDRTLGVIGEYGLYETASLFVTRALFERTGGFEPLPGLELPDGTHFGEDTWFVWRAKRGGAATTFADEALVRHAVFRRGLAPFLAEQARRRHFPALVALIPELRGVYLHHRVFLSAASLRFDLALAGAGLAMSGRRLPAVAGLAAAVPYVLETRRMLVELPPRARPRVLAGRLAADAITFSALVRGSVAARTLVL
jgi:GT2 family glycosyltransferase